MNAVLNRTPPTVWERFQSSPLLFLARLLYSEPDTESKPAQQHKIRIVCISDTHNTHLDQPPLPHGDILIHAGDLTVSGSQREHDLVLSWLESQPHLHKFFIAGNHDTFLSDANTHQYVSTNYPSLTYLEETSAQLTIHGRTLNVFGSPYTPRHGSWVFQYPRVHAPWYSPSEPPTSEYRSTQIWSRIPPLTDILITHGPPLGHLDSDDVSGCYALLTALWRVRPKAHIFGHIHAGRGVASLGWDASQKAYEEVLAGRVRWRGLLSLAWYRVLAWFWKGGDGAGAGTILVNASSVGGFRDEQRKGAIVVEI